MSEEHEVILTDENNSLPVTNNNNINFKIFSKNEDYDPLNFQPSKSAIRFGRSSECEVFINDNLLSRFQCMIEFDTTVGWTIRDGYSTKNVNNNTEYRNSTNGTWYYILVISRLYLNEDFQIFDGMTFKNAKNIFEVNNIPKLIVSSNF